MRKPWNPDERCVGETSKVMGCPSGKGIPALAASDDTADLKWR